MTLQPRMPLARIGEFIRDVPDFPSPGIVFKDMTPLLADVSAFAATIEHLAEAAAATPADGVLAIESRGFIFGAPLARQMGLPLHLVRKRGKLPRATVRMRYALEYGVDELELHADSVRPGGRYLIVDDLMATGGTASAAAAMIAQQGGHVAACLFVVELMFLRGREQLGGLPVRSLIQY